jgi:hypothetical protein
MSGDGVEYDDYEAEQLTDAIAAAFERRDSGGLWTESNGKNNLVVTAQVEFAGEVSRARGGVRTVKFKAFKPSQMRELKSAATSARSAGRSYDAKGWSAQLNRLASSERGQRAADAAGLNPSRTTYTRWLTGDQTPSRENRGRIERAYSSMRDDVRERRGGQRVAQILTEALADREDDAIIRFRDIEDLHFE